MPRHPHRLLALVTAVAAAFPARGEGPAAAGADHTPTAAAAVTPADPTLATPVFERPPRAFLRQNEDWSALRAHDPATTGDRFDPLKFIPLNDDGSVWLSLGGHARARLETFNNFGFNTENDDGFLLTRALLYADLHVGDDFRVFVEGKTAFATDRALPGGERTIDVDSAAIQQAFVDVTLSRSDDAQVVLRAGRQALQFGKQRLVSPLPWANTLRSWDGASLILLTDHWKTTAFYTQFAPVDRFDFNQADRQSEFFGVYAESKNPDGAPAQLDLYALGQLRDNAPGGGFNGTQGNEDRYTLGARVSGFVPDTGLDYEIEGAYQFGRVGDGDVNAYALATQVGYAFPDRDGKPRVFVGFDYASGDDEAGGDVETFNQLFPLGHAYLGSIDVIGRQNILAFSAGASVKATPEVTFTVAGFLFALADADDALYNAGGGIVRPGGSADSRDVGGEIDLSINWKIDAHLSAQVGYSRFFAGDALGESGSDDDIDFTYFQLLFTF